LQKSTFAMRMDCALIPIFITAGDSTLI
jgi:hypothetical protein